MRKLEKCFDPACRVNDPTCCVNDAVCCTIDVSTNTNLTTIYTDSSSFVINGTIIVENEPVSGTLTIVVFVNDTTGPVDIVVGPEECKAKTFSDINSITIGVAGIGTAKVKISYSLNYKF